MTYHIISHKRHITWHSEGPFAEFLCQASRFEILDEDIATLQQVFHNILSCNKQLQAASSMLGVNEISATPKLVHDASGRLFFSPKSV